MNSTLSKDVAKVISELVSVKYTESFPRYQKPFVDLLSIRCRGGNGGFPLPNMNRSRSLSGPGYGGHGGNVILKSTHLIDNLLHLDDVIQAKCGGDACGTSRGLHSPDTVINVPLGVIVRKRIKTDNKTLNVFWHQFVESDDCLLVARGGRGGLGPSCFKKHDYRLAEVGESLHLELELRLINDVAFIGLPNSGKTSLISSLTSYMTRIGPEEGSTTRPHVAVLKFIDGVDVRLMDLPPTCPSDTDGLKRIMRHIYRSKVIVYVLDASDDCDHLNILFELRDAVTNSPMYNCGKHELAVMTKCDQLYKGALYNMDKLYYKLLDHLPNLQVVGTSATHRLGLKKFIKTLRGLLYPENLVTIVRHHVPSHEVKHIDKTRLDFLI